MVPFTVGLLAGIFALSPVSAVEISVKATGGNKTNGHQYGFLHEVSTFIVMPSRFNNQELWAFIDLRP